MSILQYGAWYRQRVWRIWHNHHVLSAEHVKYLDRMADFHERMKYYSHLVRPRSRAIKPELTTHLPYEIDHMWCTGHNVYGECVRHPQRPSMQEVWCDQQFGARDKEWLYVGMGTWAFRLPEQMTLFQLTWQ